MAGKSLTKEQLLGFAPYPVKFSDGVTYIKPLRAVYAISLRGKDLEDSQIFEMLAQAICDEHGNTILGAEDVGNLPLPRVTKILDAVKELNAITEGAASDDLKKTMP